MQKWTTGELIALCDLHKEGKNVNQIAQELNRPYASVKSKINYIKVRYGDFFKHKYHSWTTADIETLKQMTADGCSGYEIATKIGTTPAAVYEYRRLLGIQRRQKNNGLPYGEANREDKR